MDLFVVPTIRFDLLYAFVIVRLGRRDLIWINVTANPIAEWIARQITEAFPWAEASRYLIRDRDRTMSPWWCGEFAPWASGTSLSTGLTLAEWLCRTSDRIDPARMRRPFHRLGRGTSAPHPANLRPLLR